MHKLVSNMLFCKVKHYNLLRHTSLKKPHKSLLPNLYLMMNSTKKKLKIGGLVWVKNWKKEKVLTKNPFISNSDKPHRFILDVTKNSAGRWGGSHSPEALFWGCLWLFWTQPRRSGDYHSMPHKVKVRQSASLTEFMTSWLGIWKCLDKTYICLVMPCVIQTPNTSPPAHLPLSPAWIALSTYRN